MQSQTQIERRRYSQLEIAEWTGNMQDEYTYLRGQYEEIVAHCEYLLRNSCDAKILAMARESMQQAAAELARLNRRETAAANEIG